VCKNPGAVCTIRRYTVSERSSAGDPLWGYRLAVVHYAVEQVAVTVTDDAVLSKLPFIDICTVTVLPAADGSNFPASVPRA